MEQNKPLVTIICICYNQADYVERALLSVTGQDYPNLEVIVLDDCSTDSSNDKITAFCNKHKAFPIFYARFEKNVGICKAFNHGLEMANGKYVVDFSCDDIMLPQRISKQVNFFEVQEKEVGMIYANTRYIDANNNETGVHFAPGSKWTPYSGNVYEKVISEYFIPTTTMVFRTDVISKLNGYDESLAYEDFDIWVRLSRAYKVAYQDEVVIDTRKVDGSMSSGWYKSGDEQAHSTYLVCKKIQQLNKTDEENEALVKRLKFELRQCFKNKLKKEFELNYVLLKEVSSVPFMYKVMKLFISI